MSLRQAAQQALEALEYFRDISDFTPASAVHAITALRAALAEPEQEPVAWIQKTAVDWLTTTSSSAYIITTVMKNTNDEAYVPLYHAPTPRKPLTPEQLTKIELGLRVYADNDRYDLSLHDFARAIERAHGIGEHHD